MRRLAAPLVLAAAVLAAFGGLVRHPGGLIVDGERPALQQHERRADARPGNDLTRLFLPHHLRIARAVAATGRVPHWDPAGFGGRPLVGNPQAGLWYPPVWLAWWGGSPAALGWLTMGHLMFAALGAWRLGRDAGLGPPAAIVTGAAFALGPYGLGHVAAGHVPHVWAVSWYPWAFLAARRARAGSRRGAAGLAAAWSACALAGHPQGAILLGLALGGWWVADGVALWQQRRWAPDTGSRPNPWHPTSDAASRPRWAKLLPVLVGWAPPTISYDAEADGGRCPANGNRWRAGVVPLVLALTFALTAVEWLPGGAVASWGREAGRRPSWGELGQGRVRLANVLQLASPLALGGPAEYVGRDNQWEACLAFGLVVVAMAAIGAFASERRGEVRGWLALAGGSLLFAAGPPLGLYALALTLLPPLGALRAPGRALFLATLAVAVLAGLGVEALAHGGGRLRPEAIRRGVLRGLLAVVGLVLGGCLVGFAIGPDLTADPGVDAIGRSLPRSLATTLLLGCRNLGRDPVAAGALAGLAGGLGWWARAADRRRAAASLVALALAELVALGHLLLPVAPASRFLAPDPVVAGLGRFHPDAKALGPRIHAREGALPMLATVGTDLDRTDVYDRFQLRHAAALYEPLYPLLDGPRPREAADPERARRGAAIRRAVLERLAVGAVVHDRPVPALGWPVVARVEGPHGFRLVLANPSPLPRTYVVPRAEVEPDAARVVDRLPDVPARAAVVMEADPLAGVAGPRQPFTPARLERPEPDSLRVEVATRAPGLLVVAETWLPGWSATDAAGRPMPIARGNGAQLVVPLARSGRQIITLRYRAPLLPAGLALTGLGVLATAAVARAAHTHSR
jgi:hypothetical protein